MRFYSDKVKKVYNSVEELEKAEKEFDDKAAKDLALREERSARAKEVDEAYKNYVELRTKFVEDYHNYHLTLTDKDLPALKNVKSVWDLFDSFWF